MKRLIPGTSHMIDAGFLIGASLIALLGFRTTFYSLTFLLVGAAAVLFGITAAHIAKAFKWHWITGFGMALAIYFLLGGAVALRIDTLAGILPTERTLRNLALLAISGWKGLLTTQPPVGSDSVYLVLIWLLALLAGVAGYGVARANESPQVVLLVPVALFIMVTLLSTEQPGAILIQGLGFTIVAVAWVAVRTRRRRLMNTQKTSVYQLSTAAGMVAAALLVGAFVGPVMPGTTVTPRTVLRTYLQPPLDVSQYPSPLPGLVKYSSPLRQQYYDVPLATVSGAPVGSLIRIAVLDQYTGLGWSATGTSVYGEGFRRVGVRLPVSSQADPVEISLTITPEYAGAWELRNWVPSLGETSQVSFTSDNARAHTESLAYDRIKGQILLTDGLDGDDVVTLITHPVPVWQIDAEPPVADGLVMVPMGDSEFLASYLPPLMAGGTSNWERLLKIGNAFALGFWSDGSRPGEGHYLPGNGQARLEFFMMGLNLVGSDEQFAAAFALAANRLGYPARVVFGARIGADGLVQGKDVKAWVEIQTTEGWMALPTELYIPDRDRIPENIPPDQTTHNQATDVPPPYPVEPPGSEDVQDTQATAGHSQTPEEEEVIEPPAWWIRPAMYAGAAAGGLLALFLLLVAAKLARASRRRRIGSPVKRIAGGWLELLDRARDLGATVQTGPLTRREQAQDLGLEPLESMAPITDSAMFGPKDPDSAMVATYWKAVDAAKTDMLRTQPRLRRLRARITPRSLLPKPPRV